MTAPRLDAARGHRLQPTGAVELDASLITLRFRSSSSEAGGQTCVSTGAGADGEMSSFCRDSSVP